MDFVEYVYNINKVILNQSIIRFILQAVVAMSFDPNGSLLLTCDRLGSYFNLFRIVPHPAGSSYSAVHHLYSLYRGDTPGSVQVSPSRYKQNVNNATDTIEFFLIRCYDA